MHPAQESTDSTTSGSTTSGGGPETCIAREYGRRECEIDGEKGLQFCKEGSWGPCLPIEGLECTSPGNDAECECECPGSGSEGGTGCPGAAYCLVGEEGVPYCGACECERVEC